MTHEHAASTTRLFVTPLHGSPKFFADTGKLQLLTPTHAWRVPRSIVSIMKINSTERHSKCGSGTDWSYLLSDCQSLRAAAFAMAVAPTGATRCPEACKLDTADDLTFFGAFQTKCWPGPL